MRKYIRTMPTSVRRHNLQRLREHLNLTQSTLGSWVGRSAATIKAVEIGKLALSENLAALVASVTGGDRAWLLRNDLSELMPALEPVSVKLAPEDEAYNKSIVLFYHLFDRLFASAQRLKCTQFRRDLEHYIQILLDLLKVTEQRSDADLSYFISADPFEFFKAHPEFLDPDLKGMINLDFLIKDAYRREKALEGLDRKARREAKDASLRIAKLNREIRRLKERASREPVSDDQKASQDEVAPGEAKLAHRKSRSQSPVSPERGDRRRSLKSS
jgi:DNA-binding XRE family transcriptional regulator